MGLSGRNQYENRITAVEVAMLRGGSVVFIPVQRPFRSWHDNDGFSPAEVAVIAAYRAWLGRGYVNIGHPSDKSQRFGRNSELKPRLSPKFASSTILSLAVIYLGSLHARAPLSEEHEFRASETL